MAKRKANFGPASKGKAIKSDEEKRSPLPATVSSDTMESVAKKVWEFSEV